MLAKFVHEIFPVTQPSKFKGGVGTRRTPTSRIHNTTRCDASPISTSAAGHERTWTACLLYFYFTPQDSHEVPQLGCPGWT